MNIRKSLSVLAAAAAVTLIAAAPARASETFAYTYVGDWNVDQGTYWQDEPLAYTGQEAAALVFGGDAADYVTSTNGSNVADINFSAWYSILGTGEGIFAQNYTSTLAGGLYYDGNPYVYGVETNPASAYVADNSQEENYAFRVTALSAVPEPGNIALMLAGVALVGMQLKRRSRKA